MCGAAYPRLNRRSISLPTDPLNKNEPEECCDRPAHLKNPYCMEIPIPEDDYFYRLTRVRCMDFVRAFPAVRPGCRLGKLMDLSAESFIRIIAGINLFKLNIDKTTLR